MAKLRIFVSSTCYDLGTIRSELRPFIASLGYEPVMSDYADILYDPRTHTHDSCIKEISNCDMVVCIIGSRFGGTAIPAVQDNINFDFLKNASTKTSILDDKDKLSITQLEVLKATESSIPVYAFVDEKVLHDHHVYEKNKKKPAVMAEIEFPSIQKKETATYIFEFINFITHRTHNNNIASFSKLDDIKNNLLNQWSQLFQKLLFESKTKHLESKRYMDFAEKLEDLKAVIMTSISAPNLRDTARAAIQYRHMLSFMSSFDFDDIKNILISDYTWDDFFIMLGVTPTVIQPEHSSPRFCFVKDDNTFYIARMPCKFVQKLMGDWNDFKKLDTESKNAVIDVILQDTSNRRQLEYINQNIEEWISQQSNRDLRAIYAPPSSKITNEINKDDYEQHNEGVGK